MPPRDKDILPQKRRLFGKHSPIIVEGTVREVIALAGIYSVEIQNVGARLAIDAHAGTAFTVTSPKSIGMYPVGSRVIVADVFDSAFAIILGATPFLTGVNYLNLPETVSSFTGAHNLGEIPQYYPLQLEEAAGLNDFKSGRPFEVIPGSDAGVLNELGVGYGVSRLFSWLKASDVCGIWAFYQDSLLRLGGYNFELWHAGGERTIYNDEGEVTDTDLFSPFPWEALGLRTSGAEAFEKDDKRGVYRAGQERTWWLPVKDGEQRLIPRVHRYRGYKAGLQHTIISAPEEKLVPQIETLSSKSEHTGLLEIHEHSDGFYSIRSARGVSIAKYAAIPVPKILQSPDTHRDQGDSHKNYAASGVFGDGSKEPHEKKPWKWSKDTESQPSGVIAQLFDYHAYLWNYDHLQGFDVHKKDVFVPEEKRGPGQPADGSSPVAAYYYNNQPLGKPFQYAMPPYAELKVDHRYKNGQRYYRSRSGLDLLPDGSVVLSDGYGAALIMTGGNVFTTAPGDCIQQAGRNATTLAGQDLILRAQGSLDGSSAKKDVRLKAEKNLHVLGGNSGKGGVLIESRSTGRTLTPGAGEDSDIPGIFIRATEGELKLYGDQLFAGADTSITLDAGKGQGKMVVVADSMTRVLRTRAVDAFGATPKKDGGYEGIPVYTVQDRSNVIFGQVGQMIVNAGAIMMYGENAQLMLSGDLRVNGNTLLNESLQVDGMIVTNEGVIAQSTIVSGKSASPSSGGMWGKLEEAPEPQDIEERFKDLQDAFDTFAELTSATGDAMGQPVGNNYSDTKSGDTVTTTKAGFGFRTTKQLNLDDSKFQLTETPWQQVYRKRGIGFPWDEPTVFDSFDKSPTLPYPGKDLWEAGDTFVTNDQTLWDWEKGHSKERASCAAAEGADNKRTSLKSGYLVSVKI